jgi:hypothetical protein
VRFQLVAVLIAAMLVCFAVGDAMAADYWLPVEGSDCQV